MHRNTAFVPRRPLAGPSRRPRRGAALVVLFVCGLGLPGAIADDGPDTIEEAKERREQAREEQLAVKAQLDLIDAEDLTVVEALNAATELVNLKQADVDGATQRLAAIDQAVLDAEALLVETEAQQVRLEELLRQAAIDSYVDQETELAQWLSAADATEAAGNAALVDLLESTGDDLADRLAAIEQQRADLLAATEVARAEAAVLRLEQRWALDDLRTERLRQLEIKAELDSRRARWESELAIFEQEEAELDAWIATEQARIAEELRQQQLAASGGGGSGGGGSNIGGVSGSGFQWPAAGGVGSGFGPRLHPILGYYRMHNGLDIGGAQGSPIWAAGDGQVIAAGWQGGFGNAVIIAHANGLATLYAHMSAIYVSSGQSVGRGTQIGAVGSTGLSTGPHLHFEVHRGGVPIDPRPFLP